MDLVDEYELLLYALFLEALERQNKAVLAGSAFIAGYWAKETSLMAATLAPAFEQIIHAGALLALGDIQDTAALFENERFFAQTHAAEKIKLINDTTREQVNELIQQSITEGWDIDTLTESLTEWFGDARARRIAVTETTNAYGGGAQMAVDGLRGQGDDVFLVWLTANDDRVCEICGPLHLKPQGDGWTDAQAAHVGCRCDWAINYRV